MTKNIEQKREFYFKSHQKCWSCIHGIIGFLDLCIFTAKPIKIKFKVVLLLRQSIWTLIWIFNFLLFYITDILFLISLQLFKILTTFYLFRNISFRDKNIFFANHMYIPHKWSNMHLYPGKKMTTLMTQFKKRKLEEKVPS